MSRRGQRTDLAERVEIGERWKSGQTDKQIAIEMQRPIATIRKWRRRVQHQGRAGLSSRIGRPASGVLGQYPDKIVREISKMRQEHPGWGPLTILTEMYKADQFAGKKLPSRSRIAAYLKQEGFARKYERHHEMPQPKLKKVERPHQEWEVDAQGKIRISGLGSASIINISDVFSRLKIDSLPCLQTTHANTQDYQLVLRRAFVRYGLPEQISLDHDTVFYDSQTASPFPTVLHLWLIGLGVGVRFIRKPPPLEHAVIERAHQTIMQQAVPGQTFSTLADLQRTLTDRIGFLNQDYPSRSLQGQPPLTAYPQAQKTNRPFRLEWEKDALDMQRVYDFLAQGRWFRLTSSVGMFSLGAHRYNARTKLARQTLEITFDPATLEFICLPEKGSPSFRLAAKGLTKEDLLGELDPLVSVPVYQLALPFTRQAWREIDFCCAMSGTIL
jgi:hypothetical protein